jgi:hypothetical protein
MNKSRCKIIGAEASADFNLGLLPCLRFVFNHWKLTPRETSFRIPVKFSKTKTAPVKVSVANQPPES